MSPSLALSPSNLPRAPPAIADAHAPVPAVPTVRAYQPRIAAFEAKGWRHGAPITDLEKSSVPSSRDSACSTPAAGAPPTLPGDPRGATVETHEEVRNGRRSDNFSLRAPPAQATAAPRPRRRRSMLDLPQSAKDAGYTLDGGLLFDLFDRGEEERLEVRMARTRRSYASEATIAGAASRRRRAAEEVGANFTGVANAAWGTFVAPGNNNSTTRNSKSTNPFLQKI